MAQSQYPETGPQYPFTGGADIDGLPPASPGPEDDLYMELYAMHTGGAREFDPAKLTLKDLHRPSILTDRYEAGLSFEWLTELRDGSLIRVYDLTDHASIVASREDCKRLVRRGIISEAEDDQAALAFSEMRTNYAFAAAVSADDREACNPQAGAFLGFLVRSPSTKDGLLHAITVQTDDMDDAVFTRLRSELTGNDTVFERKGILQPLVSPPEAPTTIKRVGYKADTKLNIPLQERVAQAEADGVEIKHADELGDGDHLEGVDLDRVLLELETSNRGFNVMREVSVPGKRQVAWVILGDKPAVVISLGINPLQGKPAQPQDPQSITVPPPRAAEYVPKSEDQSV